MIDGRRDDIDGLRAVAVLAVVVFHTWAGVLPGGFLGVDVFFVLSGYLITGIIWRAAERGEFSIRRFYDRRLRRIAPALLLVLGASSLIAPLILLPADLVRFAASALASLAFVANIYFWRDTSYFSPDAEQKPLLHIWSLGVEEQFYILFPILLMVLARYWRRGAIPVVVGLTAASLALNVAALAIGGDSPAFFLLPTRAWELGAGAILALSSYRLPVRAAGPIGACGLILIVAALIIPPFSELLMPAAVPAVLGAALVVLAGRSAPLRLLTIKPVVFVGLISYSLYLWHWPVLVFSRYYLVRELTLIETGAALIVMFTAAWLSWKYVETPLREPSTPVRRVFSVSAGGTAAIASAAVAAVLFSGLPSRLSAEAGVINAAAGTNYRCPVQDYIAFGTSRACLMNLPSRDPADAEVILLGNSHAQMYQPVWAELLQESHTHGLLVPANGCLPTDTVNISLECLATARRNLREVEGSKALTVILGLTWDHPSLVGADGRSASNTAGQTLIPALDGLIGRLIRSGKTVILIGPIATPGYDLASTVSRKIAYGRAFDDPLMMERGRFMEQYGAYIDHFSDRDDLRFVRPDLIQCGGDQCRYVLDGRPLFSDSNHLARAELHRFKPAFAAALG